MIGRLSIAELQHIAARYQRIYCYLVFRSGMAVQQLTRYIKYSIISYLFYPLYREHFLCWIRGKGKLLDALLFRPLVCNSCSAFIILSA